MEAFTQGLSAVLAAGNLVQIYHPYCTAGSGATTQGTLVRKPIAGTLLRIEVQPDGTNGGVIELWDMDGNDGGADVNTSNVITNAQLVVAQNKQKAVKIWSQSFAGAGTARLAVATGTRFANGLVARFVAAAGTCTLNVDWGGGNMKQPICGV